MPEEGPSDATRGENRSGKIEIVKLDGLEEGIDDKTRIVRYMKLETFLLLLTHQVFIPSHELLTSLDPLEGKLVFELPDKWHFWKDHANAICDRLKSSALWGRHVGTIPLRIRGSRNSHVAFRTFVGI